MDAGDVMDNQAMLLMSADSAAKSLDISVRQFRKLAAGGLVPAPVRLGGSVRWSCDELRSWIRAGSPPRKEWESIKPSQ